MSDRAVWQPPSGICAHDGTPLPADLDFFAVPPHEIGPVSSAYSSLKVGARPGRQMLRVAIIAGCLILGIGGGWLLPAKKQGRHVGGIVVGILGGIVGAAIAYSIASNHECQFVGPDGVACFEWTTGPNPPGPGSVLLFRDATILQTSMIESFHNGVSTGTQFIFTWQRVPPLPPFKYQGHYGSKGPVPTRDRFHFAVAADGAWTSDRLPILQEEFRRTGSATFPLQKEGQVKLTRQGVEVEYPKGENAFDWASIESITVNEGNFVIRRRGAKPGFFTQGKGIFTIPYNELANGQLFLIVANDLLDRVSGRS